MVPRLKATFQAGRRKASSKVHTCFLSLRLLFEKNFEEVRFAVTFQKGSLLKSRIGLHFSSSKLLQNVR